MLLLLLIEVGAAVVVVRVRQHCSATSVVVVVVGSIARHDQHCFGVITTAAAAIASRDAARVAGRCRDAIIIMGWYRSLSFSPPLLVC